MAGNKKWQAELEMMVETRQKAEIQALSTFGFQYLTEQYLPQKLVRTTLCPASDLIEVVSIRGLRASRC
eukprot:COSAG04_NODE_3714_length_2584_cov_1.424206_2_plen_69_part_00